MDTQDLRLIEPNCHAFTTEGPEYRPLQRVGISVDLLLYVGFLAVPRPVHNLGAQIVRCGLNMQ
jgi:hypothetical protein